MRITRITIAGIGGVGGFFGGLLAKQYFERSDIEISFIARGEHLKQIQSKGLKVIHGDTEFIAKPKLATDSPSKVGVVNYIIICTKSYDLAAIIKELQPCINSETIILPLLNGVDNREKIKKLIPGNIVLDGCVYIVSQLKDYGVIENLGNVQKLYFGLDNYSNGKLELLQSLFREAGIDAVLSKNISSIIWKKFIFLSPTATMTSCFDMNIGEIFSDRESFETLKSLIAEVVAIAKAKQISVEEDIIEMTIESLKSFPPASTSSMHRDFKNRKPKIELESLTGFVITEGQKYNVLTPTYTRLFELLKNKSNLQ